MSAADPAAGRDDVPDKSTDRTEVICLDCGGPFRYWTDDVGDVQHACMCDEPESPIGERTACRRCGDAIEIDESATIDPQTCGCPDDERPDTYRMMSKSEAIERAGEFL